MKWNRSKFDLSLVRIKDAKRNCSYAVILNGNEVSQLRFMTHGYVGWLPTPSGHGFSMPENSLSQWRCQVRRLRREVGTSRAAAWNVLLPVPQLLPNISDPSSRAKFDS